MRYEISLRIHTIRPMRSIHRWNPNSVYAQTVLLALRPRHRRRLPESALHVLHHTREALRVQCSMFSSIWWYPMTRTIFFSHRALPLPNAQPARARKATEQPVG